VSIPALKVILAVSSPTALAKLNGHCVLVSAAHVAREFAREVGQKSMISGAAPTELTPQVRAILIAAGIEFTAITCDPNDGVALAKAIFAESSQYEVVVVHDSNRPLTRLAQFHRTLEALLTDGDAARSTSAFTETLKAVNESSQIEYTIDRTTIRRVSTPEMIRITAIDFADDADSQPSGWFVPLKAGARINYVDSDPESIRVDSDSELRLLESFLHWQQTVAQ
jgi:hypothetical protein